MTARSGSLYRPLSRFWSSILTSSFRLCLWCSRYNASSCAALHRRPSITASINCLRTDRRSVWAGGFKIEKEACIVIVVSRDLFQCPATFFCKTFSVVALPRTRRSAKMRLVDGPTSSTGSRRNHRWSERGASPSQPRDHLQIFGIPYLLEMMIGLAVDFSRHQWLSQRICGAHAAEHWCGNTDSGVTTGIEVSRIRRVRLSLRDGWSNCRYGKNQCGQQGGPTRQARRHRDRSSGAQHLEHRFLRLARLIRMSLSARD